MFVSSYTTYISTNPQDRTQKERTSAAKETSLFKLNLSEPQETLGYKSIHLPGDYVDNSKTFGNRLELNRQEQELLKNEENGLAKSKELTKEFTNQNGLKSAQVAYQDGMKFFSILRKTHQTIDQTPSIDKNLSPETQGLQELNLRHVMVNTYLANDKYYQLTA